MKEEIGKKRDKNNSCILCGYLCIADVTCLKLLTLKFCWFSGARLLRLNHLFCIVMGRVVDAFGETVTITPMATTSTIGASVVTVR
jgi:hypothetical protein